jgi:hypothetical protein
MRLGVAERERYRHSAWWIVVTASPPSARHHAALRPTALVNQMREADTQHPT